MVRDMTVWFGHEAQMGPEVDPEMVWSWTPNVPRWAKSGQQWSQSGASMAPRWLQDGPQMPKRNELQGPGAGKAEVATNAIKGTLFSLFRHPGGRSETKMEAKWGRDEATSGQDEAKIEAR